jgi:hypothetical protein
MEYVNPEMLTQSHICDLQFTLHTECVNSIRYKSDPYDSARGRVRQFDIYLPREIFLDRPIPDSLRMRIMVDLD